MGSKTKQVGNKNWGGARPNSGPPPYQPTKADTETVKGMILAGYPAEKIARCCGTDGLSVPTLQKHFGALLSTYEQDMIGKVSQTLYQKAMAGDTTAMIFTLKCRARWRENPVFEDAVTQIVKRVIGVMDKDV